MGSTASAVTSEPVQTGLFAEQIFSGADGDIHYSYYLPESYDGSRRFPMMVVMPGYGMMWFGEDSSGSNLNWSGFTAWTKLGTEMIVVSAQLTDWGEKSARQAIELTEYFIENFAVDTSRVYAAGYSAGGETLSLIHIYAVECGEALHGVLARLQHPFFRGSALKYKIQFASGQRTVFHLAVEPIQHVAHAAADIVPVDRRADDDGIRLLHGVDNSIQPVAGEVLAVCTDGVVSQIQGFIFFAFQQLRCQRGGVAVLVGTAVDK